MKFKKGVSITEAVVAMVVVFIVMASVSTVLQSSSTTVTNNRLAIMANNDCSNVIECYKVAVDNSSFESVLESVGFDVQRVSVEEGTYTYSLTYNNCPYQITVVVRFDYKNLTCVAKQLQGDKVFYEVTYGIGGTVQ